MAEADRTMAGRMFAVLAAFSSTRIRMTQSEIARACDLPLPTVHRLCLRLVEHGALERESDGRFCVGVRLWELGALAPRAHGLRQVALPYLEDLYDATRENVQLVVREGLEALYLERLSARGAVRVVGRAGGRLPLHASSGGLVLLAHETQDVLTAVIAAGLPRFTPHTITDERLLRRVLDDIRRNGVAVCREFLNPGTLAIAAPLVDSAGKVVAALSIVVDSGQDAASFLPAIKAAARGASRGLA